MSTLPIYEVPHKSTHWPMAHENPNNSQICQFTNLQTQELINSQVHKQTTHRRINSQAN